MDLINPQKAFFKFENKSGKDVQAVVGKLNPDLESFSGEDIIDLAESRITHSIFNERNYSEDILDLLELDWQRLFCLIEVKRTLLFPDWPYEDQSAGDIDVILGNFYPNSNIPNFQNICGIQIKIRRVTKENELKNPSGKGTRQADATVKMGFDKTLLLHVLVKSPIEKPPGRNDLWNTIVNQIDERHIRRIAGSVRMHFEQSLFGYGILSIGQAAEHDFEFSGMHSLNVTKCPVIQPWQYREEFKSNRKRLHESLGELIKKHYDEEQPYIQSYSQHR